MAPIIEMKDVSFSYGASSQAALDHVSLSVREGEFVGVIGPAGSGRSTLAAVLSGAIPHHFHGQLYGVTYVQGLDTCEATLTDISSVVGSVLQDIDAQMVASVVEDEMLFGMENFGVPHDQIEQRLVQTLETVGIAGLRHREIATLSGGQKQKVAIAAILAMGPRVLVLDEPTAALDPAATQLVYDTLRRINRERGVTVVVMEQKVAMLSEYCDRVMVVDAGKIVFSGAPHEVFAHGEELRCIGCDSPRVTRIYNRLVADGVVPAGSPCLNVSEAEQLIARALGGRETAAAGSAKAAVVSEAALPASSPHAPAPRPKAEGAKPAVSFEDVCFSYPGGGASVQNLELAVYPGELVGVVGQNGAGKTTLTKLLNGLLKPSSGVVTVAGLDTREAPVSRIAAHVSTLFQNPDRQICRDTVLDEVAFGLVLTGTPQEEARERAQRVIERFGLPAEEAPFSLSRGQRQKIALASVVVMEPEVIVLDEPTSGLDYRECMTVMETVSEMAERGSAVIMVCHDMEVVSDFAERLVVMAQGRILGRGPTRQVFGEGDLMREASIAPPQVTELSERLARTISPAFAGLSEVDDVVSVVEEMVAR